MVADDGVTFAQLEAELRRLQQRETALVAQLTEAQAQQAATAQVLRSIAAGSPEALPVLQEIVEAAAKVCQADNVAIWSVEGDEMVRVANLHPDVSMVQIGERRPITRDTMGGRAMLER